MSILVAGSQVECGCWLPPRNYTSPFAIWHGSVQAPEIMKPLLAVPSGGEGMVYGIRHARETSMEPWVTVTQRVFCDLRDAGTCVKNAQIALKAGSHEYFAVRLRDMSQVRTCYGRRIKTGTPALRRELVVTLPSNAAATGAALARVTIANIVPRSLPTKFAIA